jgi:peptidoglycan/LPS O-acetylase OafA/YrhL
MVDSVSGAAIFAFLLIITSLALALRLMPSQAEDGPSGKATKIHTLGGLRGIVALAVVVHHSVMIYLEYGRGYYGAPTSYFQNQLGSTGVAIFFMISAYLFCGALIKKEGRVELVRFIEGRFCRILPLYAVLVFATLAFAFYLTNFTLLVSPRKLVSSIARLSLFSFVDIYSVNTANIQNFVAHVWTLRYEWLLYATLPILGFFVRLARSSWPLFLGMFLCSLYDPMFSFFVVGAAAAVLVKFDSLRAKILWQISGVAGLTIVMLAYHDSRGWPQAVLLTPFFIAVLQGHRWFAILGRRPLRVLGDISFSLYLLHPFPLRLIGHLTAQAGLYKDMGVIGLVGVIMISALISISLAVVSFRLIEQPLIGKRPLSDWLESRRTKIASRLERPVRSYGSA